MGYDNGQALAVLKKAEELARRYRDSMADLVAVIAEVDRTRAFAAASHASTFDFCVKDLSLSEDDAFRLIRSARAARARPEVLSFLAQGTLTPRAVAILAPDKTAPDFVDLLERAKGKSIREVEKMVAARHPQQPAPDRVKPISAETFKFEFCADEPLKKKLEHVKDLLSAKHPQGRLEDVLHDVLDDYLERNDPLFYEPARRGNIRNPHARQVPQSVKDEVFKRDAGRCTFVSGDGARCEATRFLEFDHRTPWARGGRSDDPTNIRLLCRAHNRWEAQRVFG